MPISISKMGIYITCDLFVLVIRIVLVVLIDLVIVVVLVVIALLLLLLLLLLLYGGYGKSKCEASLDYPGISEQPRQQQSGCT